MGSLPGRREEKRQARSAREEQTKRQRDLPMRVKMRSTGASSAATHGT